MSQPTTFSADQSDALQELLNIAMGQAGDRLARALDSYVQLTIPATRIVEVGDVSDALAGMIHRESKVTAVRQAFFNDLRGEAITLFGTEDSHHIADAMGYDELIGTEEQELLLDVTNIMVGACLNGFAHQINADIGFAPPRVMATNVALDQLFASEKPAWSRSLVMKLNFGLEARSFSCELIIFMPENCIDKVRGAVDSFLALL